ncbi:MAG TPA: MFS transporter [Parvibaculum sp.]|uniref:MFS transporter n=1 Tax=Parvibaculum sp. TaxID=2024848 RepID=UPI002CE4BC5E|nr:MFS transporter [Parvibaculum sp.]HMM15004.1 MFS transporter [Parvibaculum sp.]
MERQSDMQESQSLNLEAREEPLSRADRRRSLIAVIACITVVGIGLGSSIPLLALLMERRQIPALLIGLNTAMPAIATFMLTPFIPRLLRRVPVIPFLLACVAVSALAMPCYYIFQNVWLWFPIRFVNGLAITGLFVVSEFWINSLADEKNRGKLMGLYGTILSCGFAAGPALLYLAGADGALPFLLIGSLLLAGGAPLLVFGRGLAPSIKEKPSHGFLTFLLVAPAATLAGLIYGATETNIFNMLPIYALRSGMGEQAAAFVLTIFAAGNIAFQFPIGLIADRIDRRAVLLVCAAGGFLGILAIPFTTFSMPLFALVLFVFGGVVVGLYTVGLTLLGQRFRGADLAAANAAFVMMYSTGALVGPPLSGFAMDLWNPHGLIVAMGSLCGIYLIVAGWRYAKASPEAQGAL